MTALFLDEAFSELDKKKSAKTIRCEGKSMQKQCQIVQLLILLSLQGLALSDVGKFTSLFSPALYCISNKAFNGSSNYCLQVTYIRQDRALNNKTTGVELKAQPFLKVILIRMQTDCIVDLGVITLMKHNMCYVEIQLARLPRK